MKFWQNIKGFITSFLWAFVGIFIYIYMMLTLLLYIKFDILELYSINQIIAIMFDKNIKFEFITISLMLFLLYILIIYIKSEYIFYKERKNMRPIIVTLEELSKIWLNENHKTQIIVEEKTKFIDYGDFKEQRSKDLIKNYISKEEYRKFYSEDKINIIVKLLQILEENITLSSVASKYKSDPELSASYKNNINTTGKTSYDVFARVNIFVHTLNVVDEAIFYIKEKEQDFFALNLADCIIVALAHDIGKIPKIKNIDEKHANLLILNNPHQAVSVLFFKELFGTEYEKIIEAIGSHHSATTSNEQLTRMIIASDKNARKKELKEYLENERNAIKKEEKIIKENLSFSEQSLGDKEIVDTSSILTEVITKKPRKRKVKDEILEADIKEKTIQEPRLDENLDADISSFNGARKRRIPVSVKTQEITKNPIITTQEEKNTIEILPFDFNSQIEKSIIDELEKHINSYEKEKITSIKSISYKDVILYSLPFFNEILCKLLYIEKDENYKEKLFAYSRYAVTKLQEKGYTKHIAKGFYFSTFKLKINKRNNKLFVIPIIASIYNLDETALESKKDEFLKSIEITQFVDEKII